MNKLLYAMQCDLREANRRLIELANSEHDIDTFNGLVSYIRETKCKINLLERANDYRKLG